MRRTDLAHRLALITGGARGIGRSTAERMARREARLAIADIDVDVAERTAADLCRRGIEAKAYRLDVRSRAEFEGVVEAVEHEQGPIDVLVNNAGIMSLGGFLEHNEDHDKKQLDINVGGVLNGMRTIIPRMVERGWGHIVNISSMAGRLGIPNAAVYSASKFAVIGVTEAVRHELRGSGVHLSYVMPAPVNTDLVSGAGRLTWPPLVEPEDVARAVVYAIEKRKVEVYVPKLLRFAAALHPIMPRFLVDLATDLSGMRRVFQKVDQERRADYIARTTGRKESPKVRVV